MAGRARGGDDGVRWWVQVGSKRRRRGISQMMEGWRLQEVVVQCGGKRRWCLRWLLLVAV
ncbi:hypothetical protein SOVF_051470 [Spinacia oleracea]|nr:hypothetical protein SOVF_051470 [Spinacia oleracea]